MHETRHTDDWQATLAGDREAFNRLVRPHLDELLDAARRALAYHRARDSATAFDITPEELVGETLLRAWSSRLHRPVGVSLKAWLLGTQHRVLDRLLHRPDWERDLWAVSLDDPLPPLPLYDDEDTFWEWYQPDDLTRWEDVLPDPSADPVEALDFDDTETHALTPDERATLHFHDAHGLSVAEIAFAMGIPVEQAVYLLHRARHRLQKRRSTD